ncbi:MAG: hypothetical protein LCH58_09145 [Bacteroidetes bacterium]|jgi:hypothetical protein|uniref:hypothetical protein n=1 Tax=Phnomibacter sp. TaxID=2836217 RepID=UPI002FDE240B|nr:hypothetical protein [Bacteroidota bacterium]MCC6760473.1 hypothetical protein [Chitinophagaceae bacterium]
MKMLHKIDYYGQLLLYAIIAVLMLWKIDYFYSAYLLMGGWQLLSVLLHLPNRSSFILSKQRQYYQWVLLAIIIIFLAGIILPVLVWFGLMLLMYVSPVLAVWYTIITRIEYMHNYRRQLIPTH